MKARCIDASNCGGTLTVGKVYEVTEFEVHGERRYSVTGDTDELALRYPSRFEPVPDEPEAPAEQPKESERKLCRNTLPEDIYDSASFSDGYLHWSTGFMSVHSGFAEPVVGGKSWREALMTYPTELPKVDPYEAHRLKLEADDIDESDVGMWTSAKQGDEATARLLRGLEGEKVMERARAFPHPARNPR